MSKVYLVKSKQSESGTIETLPKFEWIQIIEDTGPELKSILERNEKVAIISESSIANVLSSLEQSNPKRRAIELFKDKFLFRKLIKDEEFKVKEVAFRDISKLQVKNKSVLKPLKGCFGTAVKIVDESTNFEKLEKEIQNEIEKNGSIFSENVLTSNEFIIEDFIEGEEYAVDMFYNSEGKPCIVNIYHHPLPKHEHYLHMIYYSSMKTFDEIYPLAKLFFERLNEKISVTDFPMHCEFKLIGNKLIPIEINAMRFGGMGLGNLAYHSFGVNPYRFFLEGREPNWTEVFKNLDDDLRFVYFIAYNSFSKDIRTNFPKIQKLRDEFTEIKFEQLFDYQKQLAFGVFCLQENQENLNRLLQINFDDFFEPII
ncbi:ATP-grasp domain-containing protein [Flavobacterium pectinovorum]|uniref:ATP-grasp domain-containing protein n=1 Tax=Flavobacterium pectinovorum TaxID=29533 RepID=A0AB36P798_9FLAO|nr:ATP-grasp domain-containing protein [Flavobacterium pectinovorum]OXB07768.1 hypothetical protein B0A72_02570 [Flavobacterium pectinovorum]SHM79891.1 ATP-grasp domain-containing protein [Flavobacterium pectinovorum]